MWSTHKQSGDTGSCLDGLILFPCMSPQVQVCCEECLLFDPQAKGGLVMEPH